MPDNRRMHPSKFRTKVQVEVNDDSRGTYVTNSQIKLKTLMLKSSLCDCILSNFWRLIEMPLINCEVRKLVSLQRCLQIALFLPQMKQKNLEELYPELYNFINST